MTDFYGTMLMLGGLVAGFMLLFMMGGKASGVYEIEILIVKFIVGGGVIKLIGLWFHSRAMKKSRNEGAVSYKIQMTKFKKLHYLRVATLSLAVVLAILIPVSKMFFIEVELLWVAIIATILCSELIGRALFYVRVIPTTMPGSYFWRNQGFEQHAIETDLAEFPQTGVVAPRH